MMQLKRLGFLAIGLLFMSETSSAEAGKKLLLETTQGQVEIVFLPDLAPNHVNRISELASSGFYDGIVFHRVIPGFMAQTGDPTGTGMGGSGTNLDAEFTDYEYRAGTVGMARSSNPDSGDSQFFICLEDAEFLNRQYTVFAEVIEGMEHVDAIAKGEPPEKPDYIVTMRPADTDDE